MARRYMRIGLALGIALSMPAAANAASMTLSSGFPPIAVPPRAHQAVADWLAQESDIEVSVFSMTLLNLQETAAGIRDGIADMGYVLTPYFPAEFSETNLAADMSMLTVVNDADVPGGLVMAAAVTEYVMLHCADCLEEYRQQNQLFLAGGSSTEVSLVCRDAVATVAEVSGKTIRVGAPVFGRWVEHMGGTQASFPGSEMFEALSQGVIDCTLVSTPDVVNFQLTDIVTSIKIGAPGGVFAGAGSMNINLDTWRSLTPEERETMLEAGARGTAEVAVGYLRQSIEAEEQIAAAGIAIEPANAEFQTANAAFFAQDLATIEQQFSAVFGVENVPVKMQTVTGLVEKWSGLVARLEDAGDVESYRQLVWDEIYAKIDAGTYGMN